MVSMNDVTKNLRDAAYVLIGLGVVGLQKAAEQGEALRTRLDARRVELDKQLTETRSKLQDLAKDVENRLEPVREQVEGQIKTLRTRINRAA